MEFKVVIPARYASTRLPGKPLLELAGRPMIEHVYRRAGEFCAGGVGVATHDQPLAHCVEDFGWQFFLTAENPPNGN